MSDNKKTYLGDGVYAEYDGYHAMLYLEDGNNARTNLIYIDPGVAEALVLFLFRLKIVES